MKLSRSVEPPMSAKPDSQSYGMVAVAVGELGLWVTPSDPTAVTTYQYCTPLVKPAPLFVSEKVHGEVEQATGPPEFSCTQGGPLNPGVALRKTL